MKQGGSCRWMQSKRTARDKIQTKTHYLLILFYDSSIPTIGMMFSSLSISFQELIFISTRVNI